MEGDGWRLEGFDKPLAVDKDSIPFLRGGSFGFCKVKATNALLKHAISALHLGKLRLHSQD